MCPNWQERLGSRVLMKRLTLDKIVDMSLGVLGKRHIYEWVSRDNAGSMWDFLILFLLFSMEDERPAIEIRKEGGGTCGWRRQMKV